MTTQDKTFLANVKSIIAAAEEMRDYVTTDDEAISHHEYPKGFEQAVVNVRDQLSVLVEMAHTGLFAHFH